MLKKSLIGIDVGGVLKKHKRYEDDEEVRWIKHSEWALKRLCKQRKMHIISYVRPERTDRLRSILRNSFVVKYIPEKRWHFVHDRYDKINIMKRYHIPTLIDDRSDIIQWVKEAGLCGIQFRTPSFPNWKKTVHTIEKDQECNT